MGGCRCTFRSCTNSTSSTPKMHFFHYPIRDPERLQQWLTFANNPDFLTLQTSQLKNRVVCQEHFREDCFMNYLHDKLTKRAVPTILKLDTGEILDFDTKKTVVTKKVETPSKSELLVLNHGRVNIEQTEFVPKVIVATSFRMEDSASSKDSDNIDVVLERVVPKLLNNAIKTVPSRRLLKRLQRTPKQPSDIMETSPAEDSLIDILETPMDPDTQYNISDLEIVIDEAEPDNELEEPNNDSINENPSEDICIALEAKHNAAMEKLRQQYQSAIEELEMSMTRKQEHFESISIVLDAQKSQVQVLQTEKESMQRELNENQDLIDALSSENESHKRQIDFQKERIAQQKRDLEAASEFEDDNVNIMRALKEEIDTLNSTVEAKQLEIKQQLDVNDQHITEINKQFQQLQIQKTRIRELEAQLQHHKPSSVASTSVSTTSASSNPSAVAQSKPVEKLAPMSKPVLFNGIKRYLNPSMVALLRMEMFGEAEREFKPDERDIAMELMKLPLDDAQPGSVYEFMRSEWRFRLPPRNSVLQWIQEREDNANNVADEWDDC